VQRRSAGEAGIVVEVVIDVLDSAYMIEVLNGILQFAAAADVEIMVSVTGPSPSNLRSPERRAQRVLDEGRAGMIVVTSAFSEAQLQAFRRRKIPVVVIDPLNPPSADVVSVGATNWAGGKAATEHLLDLGHRRIAYIGGSPKVTTGARRLAGYRQALKQAGVPFDRSLVRLNIAPVADAKAAATELLRGRVDAIFADNNRMCVGALHAVHDSRRPVGTAAFDDVEFADLLPRPLTLVTYDATELGTCAAEMLFARIDGETGPPRRSILRTTLVTRGGNGAVTG
jgi:LacI family transcriptional regulator